VDVLYDGLPVTSSPISFTALSPGYMGQSSKVTAIEQGQLQLTTFSESM